MPEQIKYERVVDRKRGELCIRQLIEEGKKFSKLDNDYRRVKSETGLYFGEIEEIYWRIIRELLKNFITKES